MVEVRRGVVAVSGCRVSGFPYCKFLTSSCSYEDIACISSSSTTNYYIPLCSITYDALIHVVTTHEAVCRFTLLEYCYLYSTVYGYIQNIE